MTTDWKALCADLADELDAETGYTRSDGKRITHPTVACARAALAEPEPEGPTDEELLELMPHQFRDDLATVSRMAAHGAGPDVGPGLFRVSLNTGALDFARAVLARWGNYPGSPDSSGNLKAELTGSPADGEVAELVAALRDGDRWTQLTDAQVDRAADLLERPSPPQPVQVSERLPGPGDCDAEGRCWRFAPAEGFAPAGWCFYEGPGCVDDDDNTHWLPADALPLPGEMEP